MRKDLEKGGGQRDFGVGEVGGAESNSQDIL
jgi:hypothetical protein